MAIHDQYLKQATKKNRQVPGTDAAGGGERSLVEQTASNGSQPQSSTPNASGGMPNPSQGSGYQPSSSPSSTEEYYQLARDQEYKLLMDKEIALEQAKANALKYTKNQIAAQGFSGTGYGSTIQTGIHNEYLNHLNEAQTEYGENMRTIDQQEREAAETEGALDFGNMASDIQMAQSVDLLNDYMASYGLLGDDGNGNMVLGSTDENGKFVAGRKPDDMSDSEWNRLKYMYNSQKYALEEGGDGSGAADYSQPSNDDDVAGARSALQNWASKYDGVDGNGYASIDELKNVRVGHKDNRSGASDTLYNIVGHEIQAIDDYVKTGMCENGTLFKVQRGGGYGEAYLILYLDGRYYILSDDDREQDEYQVSVRYNAYQGPKVEFKGK